MPKIKIEGGHKLSGTIDISGSKNSVVALIPAAILCDEIVEISNVPNISDVDSLEEILTYLNADIKRTKDSVVIDSSKIVNKEIPEEMSQKLRASYYFMSSLLGKYKHVEMYFPGGCTIGERPIDQTLKAYRALGAVVIEEGNRYIVEAEELKGAKIYLDMPSVGATINTMLAAVKAKGKTVIENVAKEPEIVNVATFLNNMGAKIKGAGTNVIKIDGVKTLKNVSYNVMPDRIEAGTLLCATAITGGEIELNKVEPIHIGPVISKLEESGCKINVGKNSVILEAPKRLKAVDIKTMPYPGFPTDMQSIFTGMLTTAKGTSMIIENIFENRYKYTSELKRMGAKITTEGKVAIVKGTKKLVGTTVEATDLRGGATLVLAGLVAKGQTTVTNVEHILRGYEALDRKLNKIGANVQVEK